ncbi:HTH-type transcriptional regulator MgrA [Planctomycetales bacterium 10988]|nr:HTH-type transcriptional regulator MgrA [Planctomycetales bacterium 10988]
MKRKSLQDDLKKREPFRSQEQEACLNLLRTADLFQLKMSRLFRQSGLTSSQYNILRILRGEGKPLPCLEIAQRTVTMVPGITGLIDRLEKAGFVSRNRSAEDRRVVYISITKEGIDLLATLDEPVEELHKQLLGHFTAHELTFLNTLLEKARDNPELQREEA